MTKEINFLELKSYIKALHCPIRWDIIELLKDGPKSSEEIFNILVNNEGIDKESINRKCNGQCKNKNKNDIKKPTLYYHLRELEAVGIIKIKTLKASEYKRAPEKVWKLNIEKLIINLKF